MNSSKNNNIKIAKGRILIAQAFMDDEHFGRTVLMLTEHNKEGSVGFVINKKIAPKMHELIDDFPEFDGTVYYGGPVANDTVHYIHNVPLLLPESYHITDDLYWGGDFGKVKRIMREGLLTKENIRFFVGYSGWSKGQLSQELDSGSWILASIESKSIFEDNNEQLWKDVLHEMGENFSVISQISNKNKWN